MHSVWVVQLFLLPVRGEWREEGGGQRCARSGAFLSVRGGEGRGGRQAGGSAGMKSHSGAANEVAH